MLNDKKSSFIRNLNENIIFEHNISWNTVKKMRLLNKPQEPLDVFDIEQFYKYFKDLYKERHVNKSFPKEHNCNTQEGNERNELLLIINDSISIEEVQEAIKGLKTGKASSLDLITNEQLKASNYNLQAALVNLFNACLENGAYPWNTTIINPLFKRGDVYNPDDYRGIAIGSNLGKLFSSILLERLIKFRNRNFPDTLNQLGFCRGAQTSDHVFTLSTCIHKYVKHARKRLYSCFVDFRKAFDTLCREALLHKLMSMGVEGKFMKCIEFMYKNSKARLKIVNKLSDAFDILSGTEQGHPMSPELFKIYIHELSENLDQIDGIEVPKLDNHNISHLFWADDLVLLALDTKSLQLLIDELEKYCNDWGLIINMDKTAIMVFNITGRLLKESYMFRCNNEPIPTAKLYCYLGICFTLSGSTKTAQVQLRQKGLRAYFSLKKDIDLKSISKEASFKLFDSLILPVATHGIQTWSTDTEVIKMLSTTTDQINNEMFKKIYKDPLERLHLSFLKWTLGIPKRTSSSAVWGDSGRFPLGVYLIKQIINYYNRLTLAIKNNKKGNLSLACRAYLEQKELNLPWIKSINCLIDNLDPEHSVTDGRLPNARLCQLRAKELFEACWNKNRLSNEKLKFYNEIKISFGIEPYLKHCRPKQCKMIAKLRMGALMINNETGRYGEKSSNVHHKGCDVCNNKDATEYLSILPFYEEALVEDERHILITCPRYDKIRSSLPNNIKSLLLSEVSLLFEDTNIKIFSNYVRRILDTRFPKVQKCKNKGD